MHLFPYVPRKHQADIVSLIRNTVMNGKTAVIESGTGTGKTVCALSGALEYALNDGRKIVYITRTKSQQKQVILESREISRKREFICIGVQGRNASTCPFMKDDPELSAGTPEELSRLCSDLKKRKDGCKYYSEIGTDEIREHLQYLRREHPDPEEFISYASASGRCPYELAKTLLPYADVAVAPYSFIAMPNVRQHFLNWINSRIDDIIIIVDEAHNIPDYLRESMTIRFSEYGLNMTDKEAHDNSDPEIHNGISVTDLTQSVRECMSSAITEHLGEEDGLIPPYFLEEGMMSSLSVSSVALGRMYKALEDWGEIVTEKKRKARKLPRSYMGSLGRFMNMWSSADEELYVKLITAPPNPAFEAYCLDPYEAAEPFRTCKASIHMSGTLSPLAEYSDALGLDAVSRTFPSPFDPGNLMTLYADDVSTKFGDIVSDPDNITRIQSHVINILKNETRNAAVFFPSYSLMDVFVKNGVPERIGRNVYYERKGTAQAELMDEIDQFRASRNSVLFAVSGGRVSEGIDFPDTDLEMAVLVGIPYPKPNAKLSALVRYCDIRYGNGWEKAIRSPTIRKMRQTIGRLIRSGTDRGAAVILDRRAAAIEELNATRSDDMIADIKAFFDGQKRT